MRYYGVYSNKMRGQASLIPVSTLGAGLGLALAGTPTASAASVSVASAVTNSATLVNLTTFTMTTKQVMGITEGAG